MIPVFRPFMGQEECDAVAEVLKSGWIGLGPKTKEFEDQFAKYIGTKYAVATNSATAALHLALKVLGVEGGEVISTPMTFVSTNHAILYNGGRPVFCDIEADTLNIDASKIEPLITPSTRAIVVVHYGGYAVDLDPIRSLAQRHRLPLVEDASHACGGEYNGQKLGSIGDLGCFSFHAVKNLATGDGGMITTNDEGRYRLLMKLRWVGISKDTWSREAEDSRGYSWYYNVDELGFKYHMNDINAAIGIAQLHKLEQANDRRRVLTRRYSEAFADITEIETPTRKPYQTKPACHNYVIKYEDRDGLNAFLKDAEIASGVHYIPSNQYDMYASYSAPTPISDGVWRRLLTLPLYPGLEDAEADLVISKVREYVKRRK